MHRRSFLSRIAAASTAPLLHSRLAEAAEAAPETTRISLAKTAALCTAPQYIAEELLRAEGFTEIRFVDTTAPEIVHGVGSGQFDMAAAYASQFVSGIEAGEPITLLAGMMSVASNCSPAALSAVSAISKARRSGSRRSARCHTRW